MDTVKASVMWAGPSNDLLQVLVEPMLHWGATWDDLPDELIDDVVIFRVNDGDAAMPRRALFAFGPGLALVVAFPVFAGAATNNPPESSSIAHVYRGWRTSRSPGSKESPFREHRVHRLH